MRLPAAFALFGLLFATSCAPEHGGEQARGAPDYAAADSLLIVMVTATGQCPLALRTAATKLPPARTRGEEASHASLRDAYAPCLNDALTQADSLTRRVQTRPLPEPQMGMLLDLVSFWKAGIRDLGPRGTAEVVDRNGAAYMVRVDSIQKGYMDRVTPLRQEMDRTR